MHLFQHASFKAIYEKELLKQTEKSVTLPCPLILTNDSLREELQLQKNCYSIIQRRKSEDCNFSFITEESKTSFQIILAMDGQSDFSWGVAKILNKG